MIPRNTSDLVLLSPDWEVIAAATGPARRSAASPAAPDLPAFLLGGPLVVVQSMTAQETPAAATRRGVGPTSPLQVGVRALPGEHFVTSARHASGAITFHLPQGRTRVPTGARRSAARGVSTDESELLTFSIPMMSGEVPGEAQSNAMRGIVSRIVKIVVMKVVDVVVGKTAEFLAQRLERRLWRSAGREEGWLRVIDLARTPGTVRVTAPTVPQGSRGLLCLHGTFSNTASAFTGLLSGQSLADLRGRYADHIYAFDHFTISKSPADNVSDLLKTLAGRGEMTFDVVTHSRGGLVLRTLLSELAKPSATARIKLGRVILVASPNLGTPLATPRRWEETVGWFANIMEMFPDNPFTTGAAWVSGALSWIAQKVPGRLPGLHAMDMDADVIASLRSSGLPAGVEWYSLVANYQASDARILARLADLSVDAFFATANDLVVPSEGGWKLGTPPAAYVAPDRVGCFGAGGNLLPDQPWLVNHLSFFSRPELHTFVRRALAGEPLGLAGVATQDPLPKRGLLRSATPDPSPRVDQPAPPIAPSATPKPACAASVATVAQAGEDQWNKQDTLHLIVLPLPSAENDRSSRVAQLLATYGSARVLAPFRLGGHEDGAGGRWSKIIQAQQDIIGFIEGTIDRDLTATEIEEFGGDLFDTLLRDGVRRLYDQARYRHDKRKLNVVFTSMIPWVADLPWEFAFDRSCQAFLGTSDVRFIRNVLTPVPADNIIPRDGPLRILVVSAQPRSVAALSLDQERSLIESSFKPLIDAGAVRVEALPEATPEMLHAKVRQSEFDVVHFIGHGEFNEETGTGSLIFEDGQGNSSALTTSCVKDILRSRGIKLVFLNACQTGAGRRADYNKGVAPGLVADGVPAVVANQYSVLDRSATTFARHFYWSLAQGLSLGDAAREARIALNYSGGGPVGWAVPVLFARNPDAVLCRAVVRLDMPPAPMQTTLAPAAPPVTVRRTKSSLSAAASKRSNVTVAVWDVNDSVPGLEELLGGMNEAQSAIEFRNVNLTAPYGIWRVDPARFNRVAYLPAERTAKRLARLAASLKADFLFCVTNLPLSDKDTANLYLWCGDDGSDPELKENRVIIFSTWGFEPTLQGELLLRSLSNMGVAALVALLGSLESLSQTKGTIGYFNAERDVAQLSGRLRITPGDEQRLRKALVRNGWSDTIVDAFKSLLDLPELDPPTGDDDDPDERAGGTPPKAGPRKPKPKQGLRTGARPSSSRRRRRKRT